MARVVVEQVFAQPLSEDEYTQTARKLDGRLDERGAAWRRSYLSLDRKRMTCEFEAPDVDAVREAYDDAGVPLNAIWGADVSAVEDYPELQTKLEEVLEALEDRAVASTRRTRSQPHGAPR